MKIILHTLLAGPDGVLQPGPHNIPSERAQALVAAGVATLAEPVTVEVTAPAPIEVATVSEPETADAPKSVVAPRRKQRA